MAGAPVFGAASAAGFGCGHRDGRVEHLQDLVRDVDRIVGVDEAGLELVEDERVALLLADLVDDREDAPLELRELLLLGRLEVAVGVVLEALEGDRLLLVALLERVALVVGQRRPLVGQLLLHVAELLGELVALFLLRVVQLLDPVEGFLAERRFLDEAFDVDHADLRAAPPRAPGAAVPWALATAAIRAAATAKTKRFIPTPSSRKRGSVAKTPPDTTGPYSGPFRRSGSARQHRRARSQSLNAPIADVPSHVRASSAAQALS